MTPMLLLRKLFVCWWGGCGMVTQSDDQNVWGECLRCGKKAALCSREALRRYIEAEESRKDFDRTCKRSGTEQ